MPRIRQYAARYAMVDLASHIKGRAKDAGIRQQELGEALGMSQQGISRLLNHPESISLEQLRKICSVTEIDTHVILNALGIKQKKEDN